MAPIELPQPLGQQPGAGAMAPSKGDLSSFGSAKWLGTFAKQAGPIWTTILTAVIGAFYLVYSAGVWVGDNMLKPGFEDWRTVQKITASTNAEMVILLKDLQQERAKSAFDSHRRDSFMETQTLTMQAMAKSLERMEQQLNSLSEGK